MSEKESYTKKKIMKVVLAMFRGKGDYKFTTREIAKKAKVNIAAINYHFGSKSHLIYQAERYFSSELHKTLQESKREDRSTDKQLMAYCMSFTRYVLANPGIEKSVAIRMISENTRPERIKLLKNNVSLVKSIIRGAGNDENEQILDFKSAIFLSSLIYPLLISHYVPELMGTDYPDTKIVKKYYCTLISAVLSSVK